MMLANKLTAKLSALALTLSATTFSHGGCSDNFLYLADEVGVITDTIQFGPPANDGFYYEEGYYEEDYVSYDDGFDFYYD